MNNLLLYAFIIALFSAGLGGFWTKCLEPNMIFSEIGKFIRDNSKGANVFAPPTGWRKLLKATSCSYCVSTWINIVVCLYFISDFVHTDNKIFLMLLSISINYIFVVLINYFKIKNE